VIDGVRSTIKVLLGGAVDSASTLLKPKMKPNLWKYKSSTSVDSLGGGLLQGYKLPGTTDMNAGFPIKDTIISGDTVRPIDKVTVYLQKIPVNNNPYQMTDVAMGEGWLMSNGQIYDLVTCREPYVFMTPINGATLATLPANGNYGFYVVHKNHLPVVSRRPNYTRSTTSFPYTYSASDYLQIVGGTAFTVDSNSTARIDLTLFKNVGSVSPGSNLGGQDFTWFPKASSSSLASQQIVTAIPGNVYKKSLPRDEWEVDGVDVYAIQNYLRDSRSTVFTDVFGQPDAKYDANLDGVIDSKDELLVTRIASRLRRASIPTNVQ
jgi:hypothetical protein